jgi:hypothetical protein
MPCGFLAGAEVQGKKASFLMNKTFHLCDMFHISHPAKAFNDEDFQRKIFT